jgi:hypothetical protein
MIIAYESRALGNLPETVLKRYGRIHRDNTKSGRDTKRVLMVVDKGQERSAWNCALSLHNRDLIALEPLTEQQTRIYPDFMSSTEYVDHSFISTPSV